MTAEVSLTDKIIAEARRWEGTPYRHQHSTFGQGCDCLGLIRGVWRNVIGEEPLETPNYSQSWDEVAKQETLLSTARQLFERSSEPSPGDVLVFRLKRGMVAKHCAIMTTENRMVHAYNGVGVKECYIVPWWRSRIAYSGSFPGVS